MSGDTEKFGGEPGLFRRNSGLAAGNLKQSPQVFGIRTFGSHPGVEVRIVQLAAAKLTNPPEYLLLL